MLQRLRTLMGAAPDPAPALAAARDAALLAALGEPERIDRDGDRRQRPRDQQRKAPRQGARNAKPTAAARGKLDSLIRRKPVTLRDDFGRPSGFGASQNHAVAVLQQ